MPDDISEFDIVYIEKHETSVCNTCGAMAPLWVELEIRTVDEPIYHNADRSLTGFVTGMVCVDCKGVARTADSCQ